MSFATGDAAANTADNYRRYAVDRAFMIGLAQSWARLAAQAEKNSQLDLVYESRHADCALCSESRLSWRPGHLNPHPCGI